MRLRSVVFFVVAFSGVASADTSQVFLAKDSPFVANGGRVTISETPSGTHIRSEMIAPSSGRRVVQFHGQPSDANGRPGKAKLQSVFVNVTPYEQHTYRYS